MSKHYSLLLMLFLPILFISSCKKDTGLPIENDKNSNLTESQKQTIVDESLKLLKDPTPVSPREADFLEQLHAMSLDVDRYYQGVDDEPDWQAKYNRIRANMHARVNEVAAMSNEIYNNNEGRMQLSKNAFVLASYASLEKYMSEFMWTKLGLFVANEVRYGIVLSYVMRQVLIQTKINWEIPELQGMNAKDVFYQSGNILMEGQINVFTDIGALGLLSHRYGPEVLMNEPWLTQQVRDGYKKLVEALAARDRGDVTAYQDLQTEAAIYFGAHEQLYTLAPVWATSIMTYMSDLNIQIHNMSKGDLAIFGDIFMGANKLTETFKGYVIKLPIESHQLTSGEDRVKIAINGFNKLNELRKSSKWSPWIESSENKLGSLKGIYNIKGFNP